MTNKGVARLFLFFIMSFLILGFVIFPWYLAYEYGILGLYGNGAKLISLSRGNNGMWDIPITDGVFARIIAFNNLLLFGSMPGALVWMSGITKEKITSKSFENTITIVTMICGLAILFNSLLFMYLRFVL